MSNAFGISKNATHTSKPNLLIRVDTVERLDIKPHCLVEIGEQDFKKFLIAYYLTWRSISLLTTGRTDTGLQPDGSVLFVPLGIGVILPIIIHADGKYHWRLTNCRAGEQH